MSYWNEEDDDVIVCPYCGEEYEPSYEDTFIGDDKADCYTEDTQTFTCSKCKKNSLCMVIRRDGNIIQRLLMDK